MLDKYLDEEELYFDMIPKYRKRKQTSRPKKSSHKHQYKKYIGMTTRNSTRGTQLFPVEVCTICQKIGDIGLMFTRPLNNYYSIVLNDLKDIQELYPDLEIKKFKEFPW